MLNNLNETIQNVQKNLNQTTQIFQQRNRVVIFFFPWKLRGKQNISFGAAAFSDGKTSSEE